MIQNYRLYYLDILRILAIMAVVMIHTVSVQWYSLSIDSFAWIFSTFMDSACRWAVPVFFMISGAIFLNIQKELSIFEIFKKHIIRLIVSFLFWSMIYALIQKPDSAYSFIRNLMQGPFHFWFFFPLISIYLLIPILKGFVSSSSYRYYLILGFICGIALPQFLEHIPLFIPTFYENPICLSIYINYHKFDFYPVLGYSFYYILGSWLSIKSFNHRQSVLLIACLPIGIVSTWLMTIYTSKIVGSPNEIFFDYFSITVFLESIGIFELVKLIISLKIQLSERFKASIAAISKYTFGIYLCHILIRNIVNAKISLAFIPYFLQVIILWGIVYIGSLIISAVLNHIPFLNKYIV